MHDQLLLIVLFSSLLTNKRVRTGSSPITSTKYEHYSKLTKFSSLYIVIRTHQCISKVINFETTKSGHNLLHDPILPNINFNQLSYLI